MSTQETQWGLVGDLLRRARSELAPTATQRVGATAADIPTDAHDQFDLFLENNELGLAWDTLATIAEEMTPPRGFWEKLLLAAGLMSAADQAHLAATRLCEPRLFEQQVS
jgi:hypothetical protein